MADKVGGSLEQLDALAAELRRQSTAAGELRAAVKSRLDGTFWEGDTAQSFRDRWDQDYNSALDKLEEDLRSQASYVTAKCEQLRRAGNS